MEESALEGSSQKGEEKRASRGISLLANIVHHPRPNLSDIPPKMRSILILAVFSAACVNSRDAVKGKSDLAADSTAKSVIGVNTANAQPPAPATGNLPAEVVKLRTDPQ